jgi:hypothetical protein
MLVSNQLVPAPAGLKPVVLDIFFVMLYCDGACGWLGSKLCSDSADYRRGWAPIMLQLCRGLCLIVTTKKWFAGQSLLFIVGSHCYSPCGWLSNNKGELLTWLFKQEDLRNSSAK